MTDFTSVKYLELATLRVNRFLSDHNDFALPFDDLYNLFIGIFSRHDLEYFQDIITPRTNDDWYCADYQHDLLRSSWDQIFIFANRTIALSVIFEHLDGLRLYPSHVDFKNGAINFYLGDELLLRCFHINYQAVDPEISKRAHSAFKGLSTPDIDAFFKRLSDIPGFSNALSFDVERVNFDLSLVTFSSTSVTRLSAGFETKNIVLPRGMAQECLAAFFGVESWNHLVAKENASTAIRPVSVMSFETISENEHDEPFTYEEHSTPVFFKNTYEAIAGLSSILKQHDHAHSYRLSTDTFFGLSLHADALSAQSVVTGSGFNLFNPHQCYFDGEVTSFPDFTETADSALPQPLMKLFGSSKSERLANTKARLGTKDLYVSDWVVYRYPGIPGIFFVRLDQNGRRLKNTRPRAFPIIVKALSSEFSFTDSGECVLVRDSGLSDIILTGIDRTSAKLISEFAEIPFFDCAPYKLTPPGETVPLIENNHIDRIYIRA